MSNNKKQKTARVHGQPGSKIALDEKGRVYYIPDGIQKGATLTGERRKRGLDGTYAAGTCLGCITPTDTSLGIQGIAEAHLSFLEMVGFSRDEALIFMQLGWRDRGIWDGDPEHVPDGTLTHIYRVCAGCAPRGMEVREMHGDLNIYTPHGLGLEEP